MLCTPPPVDSRDVLMLSSKEPTIEALKEVSKDEPALLKCHDRCRCRSWRQSCSAAALSAAAVSLEAASAAAFALASALLAARSAFACACGAANEGAQDREINRKCVCVSKKKLENVLYFTAKKTNLIFMLCEKIVQCKITLASSSGDFTRFSSCAASFRARCFCTACSAAAMPASTLASFAARRSNSLSAWKAWTSLLKMKESIDYSEMQK